jgi:hypothetical protein
VKGVVLAIGLSLGLVGCSAPVIALASAGLGYAASATNADVTVLGWIMCKKGYTAACAPATPAPAVPAPPTP